MKKLVLDDWLKGKEKYKLCLVLENTAYFTNIPLEEQTGDGWQKAHYCDNAGLPYKNSDDQIISVMFDDEEVGTPMWLHDGSASVLSINKGCCPWVSRWWGGRQFEILAGASIKEFVETMLDARVDIFINAKEVFEDL